MPNGEFSEDILEQTSRPKSIQHRDSHCHIDLDRGDVFLDYVVQLLHQYFDLPDKYCPHVFWTGTHQIHQWNRGNRCIYRGHGGLFGDWPTGNNRSKSDINLYVKSL